MNILLHVVLAFIVYVQANFIPACNANDYDLLGPFKRGSQGTSYLLRDRLSSNVYVQKIFNRANDYQRELNIFQRLSAHENIISVHCASTQAIVMERAENGNLLEWQGSRQDVPMMILQLVDAVLFLHSQGIIHGDIKPLNAVVSGVTVKLIDFGFAGGPGEMRCGYGTPGFMAPELVNSCTPDALGPGIDWYAVGVTAYMLLVRDIIPDPRPTNLLPFDSMGRLKDIPEDIPKSIDSLIASCLERDAHRRMSLVVQWLNSA